MRFRVQRVVTFVIRHFCLRRIRYSTLVCFPPIRRPVLDGLDQAYSQDCGHVNFAGGKGAPQRWRRTVGGV